MMGVGMFGAVMTVDRQPSNTSHPLPITYNPKSIT
jgi:hypothetical protein